MAKEVRVPVKVVGDERAKRDLRGVKGEVAAVGDAHKKQAAGAKEATRAGDEHTKAQRQTAAATKKTAQATKTFDDSAKTAAK